MKKLGYAIAAVCAIAVAAPSIASAETVVIKRGDRDHYRARAEFREHRAEFRERDRGWRHHDRDRVVIFRHHRHHHEY